MGAYANTITGLREAIHDELIAHGLVAAGTELPEPHDPTAEVEQDDSDGQHAAQQ